MDGEGAREPRADVDELGDPGLGGQVPGDPGQECPVIAGGLPGSGHGGDEPLPGVAVGGVVVFAAYYLELFAGAGL